MKNDKKFSIFSFQFFLRKLKIENWFLIRAPIRTPKVPFNFHFTIGMENDIFRYFNFDSKLKIEKWKIQFLIFIGNLKIENPFFIFQFLNLIANYASRETVISFFLISLAEVISSFYPQKRKKFTLNSLKRDRSRNSNEEKGNT